MMNDVLKSVWFPVEETEIAGCPLCGGRRVKHIIKEGARYHVTSWYKGENGALSHCSEKDCEKNHGEGHCVPMQEIKGKSKRLKEILK